MQLGGELHAGGATTDHDKMQQPVAFDLVGQRHARPLEAFDDALSDRPGVGEFLEKQPVFGHARNTERFIDRTDGNHEPVVVEQKRFVIKHAFAGDGLGVGIDGRAHALIKRNVAAVHQRSDRFDDAAKLDGAHRGARQQGTE